MSTKITPQTLKGFRDFLPDQAIKRNWLINKLKNIFEKYGFDPLETPALEYASTLLGKYGQEADKLLYLFEDHGKRKVGLRYDQTVPLARIISQYQNITKPFKRYQIQPVWRAENTQKGRYREFLQCDIDIVGEKSLYADFEIIDLVLKSFKSLGFKKTKVLINDRKNFQNINNKFINSIDKLPKIGEKKVIEELIKKGLEKDKAQSLLNEIKNKKKTFDIEKLFSLLKNQGYQENIDFIYLPTLARGLDYYTGLIFEVIDEDYQAGSLGGGGRYDNLIGLFTGQDMPAVGFAFGFDRIIEAAESLNLLPNIKTNTQVLVTIFSPDLAKISLKIAEFLRKNNINTEVYLNEEAKLDKQLKYANKKNIPYVIIIGPEEAEKNLMKLKNMKTGEQKLIKKGTVPF
ncbi:MAG: histidine--tRNA ligase [Patescibacteria group bacterium]|nr:MAG: histidine--tRNA ligase [Patescibacteria group bacterium]